MSTDLDTFIDEVVTTLRTVTGVKVTGEAGDALKSWPAAPVWSAHGRCVPSLGSVATWTHEVRVGLLGPASDIDRTAGALLPLLESLVEALQLKMLANEFTSIDHFGDIEYVFGPIDWAGQAMFGFMFTIHGVTIRREMT